MLWIRYHFDGCPGEQADALSIRFSSVMVSLGAWEFCHKVPIFGQYPKIGHQECNDLQTPKLSKKPLCYRTVGNSAMVVTWVRREGLLHGECAPGVRDVWCCSWGRGEGCRAIR
jgi:hypothetical protein